MFLLREWKTVFFSFPDCFPHSLVEVLPFLFSSFLSRICAELFELIFSLIIFGHSLQRIHDPHPHTTSVIVYCCFFLPFPTFRWWENLSSPRVVLVEVFPITSRLPFYSPFPRCVFFCTSFCPIRTTGLFLRIKRSRAHSSCGDFCFFTSSEGGVSPVPFSPSPPLSAPLVCCKRASVFFPMLSLFSFPRLFKNK